MILILGLGILATYTGYVIGQFKLRYPHVHNMADAGEVMAGPVGREIFGAAQMMFLVFIMGSHILTFSIMLNTVTNHGTCSIVFGFVGLLLSLICTLPRTLLNVSYMAIVSFISIIAAVLITMIGVGVERPGDGHIDVTVQSNLAKGFLAATNIVFAYAGKIPLNLVIENATDKSTRTRRILLLHLGVKAPRAIPQSPFPPPRLRRKHVSYRSRRNLPIRRRRRSFPSPGLHLPNGTKGCVRDRHPNHPCGRRHQWARGSQVRLRPAIPRHRSHEQEIMELLRHVGHHRDRSMDGGVDHRRGDPGVQRSAGVDLRAVRELVHVRAQWSLLVIYQPGAVFQQ